MYNVNGVRQARL